MRHRRIFFYSAPRASACGEGDQRSWWRGYVQSARFTPSPVGLWGADKVQLWNNHSVYGYSPSLWKKGCLANVCSQDGVVVKINNSSFVLWTPYRVFYPLQNKSKNVKIKASEGLYIKKRLIYAVLGRITWHTKKWQMHIKMRLERCSCWRARSLFVRHCCQCARFWRIQFRQRQCQQRHA